MTQVSVPPPASRNVGRLTHVYRTHRERAEAHRAGQIDRLPEVPCGTCNACCTLPAPLEPGEVAHPSLVVEERDGLRLLARREDGSCIHLEEGRCTVYEHRPITCRVYDCRPFFAFGVETPGELPMQRAFEQWHTKAASIDDEALVLALTGLLAQAERAGVNLDDACADIAARVARDLDNVVRQGRERLKSDPALRRQVRERIAARLSKGRR